MARYKSFKLDALGDLETLNGSFIIIEDQDVIKQAVEIALESSKKDWFLNLDDGITYFGDDGIIGSKRVTQRTDTEFQAAVLNVLDGNAVDQINSYRSNLENNTLTVDLEALTVFGSLRIQQTISL
jgi:hypothetical protein